MPSALICILHPRKLTTVPLFWEDCRQSNNFFTYGALMKVEPRPEITSYNTDFLIPRLYPPLSSGHLTLIYQTDAGELTTKARGGWVRRQFLPIS